jgi:hypothetical protein
MATVGEIKPGTSQKVLREALIQLCIYARHILKDQFDRRFTVGFTLCQSLLHLYLFDRSGVVGTKKPIDIHAVRVIRPGCDVC